MLKIRPSASPLQIPMAQQNLLQKLIALAMTLRSAPITRKTIFLAIVICILIVYLGPIFYGHLSSVFSFSTSVDTCLSNHLRQHEQSVNELDAFIEHHNEEQVEGKEPTPLQFVGNGKLGAVVRDVSSLYLFFEVNVQEKKGLNSISRKEQRYLRLPYFPMIKIKHGFSADSEKSASVINFREGIVERLSCYKQEEHLNGCVFLNHTVVAHRSRPNVFLQHIRASYDGSSDLKVSDIEVLQEEFIEDTHFKQATGNDFVRKQYKIHSGVLEISAAEFIAVTVASKISGSKLHPTTHNNHVDAMTVVMHSEIQPAFEMAKVEQSKLERRVVEYADEVMKMSTDELLKEHRAAWKDILHTGLSISTDSKYDPGIPDPGVINATLYYVLSSSDSKLHDKDIPAKERRDLINRLQTPDFCYQGHPTFHGKMLWSRVTSVEDVVALQRRWALTLSKKQCSSLVSEGAEGLLQAMLLSFGGLQFTESDLRLGTDPDVLHNDIAFHSLIYRNDTLDISIRRVKDSETPIIMVTLREPSKIPLYACEAGCIRDAVELSMVPQTLPVYVTDPITSILYISHDKKHLSDLKETLHVRTIIEHAQHMEAIRRGSGLPTIFWVGIGSLIVFFHMFLIRLIYKEYKSPYSSSSSYLTSVGVGSSKHSHSSRGVMKAKWSR